MKTEKVKRILEILPGALSWLVIISLVTLFAFMPVVAGVVIIVYLIYWMMRLCYMTCLMVMSNYRMRSCRKIDWLKLCHNAVSDIVFDDVLHVVLYPTYREDPQVLIDSLNALKACVYPHGKFIVVLAGEEREIGSRDKLQRIKAMFDDVFGDILIKVHPKNVPGEIPSKGANATYASRQVKEYFAVRNISVDKVIISCFDADTCPDKNYFSCLTYHFITNPHRHRISYQPFPIYNNNIYTAPALARVLEIGSTLWQFVEAMRFEK